MYEYRTEICQDFATAKNIKLEIRDLPVLVGVTMKTNSSEELKIFSVQKK